MKLLAKLEKRAKKLRKKIIFPEDEDERVIEAACIISDRNIAVPCLIGERAALTKKIEDAAAKLGLKPESAAGIKIIEQSKLNIEIYAQKLYELRKNKGLTIEEAKNLISDKMYLATMMLKMGEADGVISGACHPTSHTLRPAFKIIKTKPGVSIASGCFLMIHKKGTFVFADCGINPNPDENQLSEIAISAANTAKDFGIEPRVAMLSFSTKGSAQHETVDKVRNATLIANRKRPDLLIEGEMQLDSAIVPEICKMKYPDSKIMGTANVLIFPNLDAGNIGYKLVQRFGCATAIGPIVIGLNMAVNDLSRGCSSEDIVDMAIITAIQAEELKR